MKIGLFELSKLGFHIELKKEFRRLIKKEIYKKFKSVKEFTIKTRIISSSFLFDILKAKKYTQFSIWLKICKVLGIDLNKFKKNILKIRTKKKKSNFITLKQFPILPSPGLALLVGHGLSDGHISKVDNFFEYTNKDISLHIQISKTLHSLFNIDKYVRKKGSKGILRTRYNRIVGSIIYLAGVPMGNKIIQPYLVPEWIMHGSKEIKTSFIRALFDDEGTVKVNSKEVLIKFSKNEIYVTSLQKFMKQIKQLLEDLGIEVTSIRKGSLVTGKNGNTIQLVLGIHGYKNFVRFSKKIGFNHKHKQMRLEKMISNYISFQHKKGKVQNILYKSLGEPQTIGKLRNKLNMTYMVVYKNLKKLERDGLIKKVVVNKTRVAIWKRT